MPIDELAAGAPVLRLSIPAQIEPSAFFDQLAPITGVLLALFLTVWAVIRSEVIRGFVQDAADRAEVYIDRQEHSDRPRHDVTVPAAKAVNWTILRHFSTGDLPQLKRHLEAEGFSWLDRDDFEDVCDPETCWRRPFRFSEVREGYAIERERPVEGRPNFVEELVEELQDEHARALIDLPGSGKSTICKLVASRWDADGKTGPVLYRTSWEGKELSDRQRVEEAIDEATRRGRVLVVVEDAARADVVQIYQIMSDYRSVDDVCFLLDSHEHEWKNFDERLKTRTDFGLEARKKLRSTKTNVPRLEVPALDQTEVTRVVDRFEEKTRKEVTISAGELFKRINGGQLSESGDGVFQNRTDSRWGSRDGTDSPWACPMLLLAYHLPVGLISGQEVDNDHLSLVANVQNVLYEIRKASNSNTEVFDIESNDEELLEKIGLLINILNATDFGVCEELIYSLADNERDHETIEYVLGRLQGRLLFGNKTSTCYWSHHELWSELYLDRHLKESGSIKARRLFEEVVNKLLSFIDDEARESRIPPGLRDTALLEWIEENPQLAADSFLEDVFDIGRSRPKLAALFGRTIDSGIPPPGICSDTIEVRCSVWRGNMYLAGGDLGSAQEEYEYVIELADEADVPSDHVETLRATSLNNLGRVARKRGDLEAAKEYHEQSLAIAQEVGDRQTEATSLDNLGVVTYQHNNLENAEEYFKQSLAIYREVGDRQGEATNLDNLGRVAEKRNNLDTAEEYHEQSLAIAQEVGDRQTEATSLDNLGRVAEKHNDLETAEEYFKQSLAIAREVGDRLGEATSLHNLGKVAEKRSNLEAAEEYYEQSLTIDREVGDRPGEATNLHNLGVVAQECGDLEGAEEYYEQSLSIFREVGDRVGIATSLYNLGVVVQLRSDLAAAEEYYEQSLAIYREVGDRHGEALSLTNLWVVAEKRNNLGTAEEYFKQSLAIYREVGDRQREAASLDNLGVVTYQRNNLGTAAEYFKQSLAIYREVGDRQDEATRLKNLGLIALKRGDLEAAEECFEEAIETLLAVGAMATVFTAIEDVVIVCERRNAIEEAVEWCDQAIELAERSSDCETVEQFQNLQSALTQERPTKTEMKPETRAKNAAPIAKIEYIPREPTPGIPVSFDGSMSFDSDPSDTVISYRWTVDDREWVEPQFEHTFIAPGEYDVVLNVVNTQGRVGTRTETITVEEGPWRRVKRSPGEPVMTPRR